MYMSKLVNKCIYLRAQVHLVEKNRHVIDIPCELDVWGEYCESNGLKHMWNHLRRFHYGTLVWVCMIVTHERTMVLPHNVL